MTRALIIAFTLVTLGTTHVSASAPEVHVQVTTSATSSGYQLDWDGDVLREHGEEFCDTAQCLNATLARIGTEWTYSVTWMEV